ncbi:MAG TPA: DUF87 domain-containing protein [Phycisphaerae bacterium]|nr:DUF87 domain-containing protein [Phycisphaerae bacterium]
MSTPWALIHYGKEGFYRFGLREDEFIQHIGVFGRSGSGKTNLAYLLLRGLFQAGKPFLVFDWKRNCRDLVSSQQFDDLTIFTVGRAVAPFRFNPLIPPPGTPATVWLKKLIEIMCHAYFLGEGVTVLVMRAIDALYRQAGLYHGRLRAYPTMPDVGAMFDHSIEPDGVTLKAVERGAVLTNQTWYQITPAADFVAEPFALDVCTLVGDANNSGRVATADYSLVKDHMNEQPPLKP